MYSQRYTALATEGSPTTESRADVVCRALYEDLLQGRLAYGVALAEGRVAQRYGVSRTPAREALRRLEADGHLIRQESGGLAPRPPSFAEMRDKYELRVILELAAAARAATDADRGELAAIRADWEARLDDPDLGESATDPGFVRTDESFHVAVAAAAGNAAIVEALQLVNDRIRLVRSHDFREPGRIASTVREHLGVLAAIEQGDPGVARTAMREHIELSASVVERLVGLALSMPFEEASR